jgi:FAD/FMN-containing dehydrogenase
MTDALAAEIGRIVGPEHVLTDAELRGGYERDWTGRFAGRARFFVRPGSTGEVAAVLRACSQAAAGVVPHGGGTGLVGGAVPRDGEVVLSLARLDRLEPVDETTGQVTVGAGTTLAAVQAHVRPHGLELGVDHGARDSATVGGAVATNAGGIHAVRYGTMRANVTGLEAVLADGTVLERLAGLPKDTAGYDLPALLVGSEGTLAVVTRVRLRLVPRLPYRATVLLALADTAAAVDLARRLRRSLSSLEALEILHRDGLGLVCAHARLAPPFAGAHETFVLVECAAREDPLDELLAVLDTEPALLDAAVGTAARDREALWAYREALPEAVAAAGVPHKLDVSLPLAALAEFTDRVTARVAEVADGARTIVWGHLGDGNLHVNVLGPDPDDERVDEAVLHLVAELGGSISAEHGVGVAKRRFLGLTRSDGELAAMRRIKHALDPDGILNPGVLFAPEPDEKELHDAD